MNLRSALLLLLPACAVSAADPTPAGAPPRRPVAPVRGAGPAQPIVRHGSGCRQELAAGARGGVGPGLAARGPSAGGGAPAAYRKRAAALAEEADGMVEVAGMAPPPPSAPPSAPSVASASAVEGAPGAAVEARPIEARQAGIASGEWDDNANFRDYARWLSGEGRGVARLDVAARQFVVVSDAEGKPVPSCRVTVAGAGARATLVTPASGRALLFPAALGLRGPLTATASCGGATASAAVPEATDGVVQLRLGRPRALPARRAVDLAFVLDTTGSMSEEIEAVKQTIRTVAAQLGGAQTDIRVGLVEYKDREDCVLTRAFPFSADLAAFARSVDELSADGGGDTPEDMQAALAASLDDLRWRDDAVARMVVVIADAPPHLDYANERDYADAARRAASRGIKLFTVSASGMDDVGQVVMRQLAQYTGGTNMFVLRGGAGPQSTGGGDPRTSCGGTHEDYASGNLDQLIVRKVRQELASVDADPMRIPGRGQDENAKPCDQRLVVAR